MTFFKWTTHRRNRYLHRSPLELAPLHYGTPEFIDYKGVQRLFDEACETDTGMIPFLALGFFAGIRTDEILRLKSAYIQTTDKRINVRAELAKPKRKGKPLPRLIEGLPETLEVGGLNFVRCVAHSVSTLYDVEENERFTTRFAGEHGDA